MFIFSNKKTTTFERRSCIKRHVIRNTYATLYIPASYGIYHI